LGLTLEKKVKDNIKGKNPEQEKSISHDLWQYEKTIT